jgi:hypothetical protein
MTHLRQSLENATVTIHRFTNEWLAHSEYPQMSSTEGPYQPPTLLPTYSSRKTAGLPSRKTAGLLACLLAWLCGTFALSLVVATDMLLPLHLPGASLYVVFVASPTLTFLSSMLAPLRIHLRVLSFLISIMLMCAQFVILFFLLLATSGFDGVH